MLYTGIYNELRRIWMKKPYTTPNLKVFGSLTELTKNNAHVGGGSSVKRSRNRNRKFA
jgi:hypothetical protein